MTTQDALAQLQEQLDQLLRSGAPLDEIVAAETALADLSLETHAA